MIEAQRTQDAPESGAAQQPAPSTPETPSRPQRGTQKLVYGLDGAEPIPLRDYTLAEMASNPEFVDTMKRTAEQVIQKSEGVEQQQQPQSPSDNWQARYEQLLQQHNQISQYGNIIKAMENDPSLVSLMQRAIAGEVASMDRREESGFDYDDAFETEDPKATRTDGKSRQTDEQRIAAAREQGMREAMVQIEMKQAIDEFMEAGGTPEQAQAFQEFLQNPSGLSARDFLSLYRAREERQNPKQPPKGQKQLPPMPLASVNGQTDRPSDTPFVATPSDGSRYFPGDPNKF